MEAVAIRFLLLRSGRLAILLGTRTLRSGLLALLLEAINDSVGPTSQRQIRLIGHGRRDLEMGGTARANPGLDDAWNEPKVEFQPTNKEHQRALSIFTRLPPAAADPQGIEP